MSQNHSYRAPVSSIQMLGMMSRQLMRTTTEPSYRLGDVPSRPGVNEKLIRRRSLSRRGSRAAPTLSVRSGFIYASLMTFRVMITSLDIEVTHLDGFGATFTAPRIHRTQYRQDPINVHANQAAAAQGMWS